MSRSPGRFWEKSTGTIPHNFFSSILQVLNNVWGQTTKKVTFFKMFISADGTFASQKDRKRPT